MVLSLSLSLVLHKFSVERLYHTSIVRTQQVYSPVHCCADILPSVVKPIPHFIHISHRNSSDSYLSQKGSENLPQHSLHQQKQYNLSSVPPNNWPRNSTENYVHSIPTKHHHSTGIANSVAKNYHLYVHMQQGQYASKYVKFGAESVLLQHRKSQTEIVHHSDHIPYTSQLQPGCQEVQVVPSRVQQSSQLKNLEVLKCNTTLLSRDMVSMAAMQLSEQLLELRGFPVAMNKDLVSGRHFPPWKMSSEVASHFETLHQVINDTELSRRNWTQCSLNEDIGARSKVW